MLWYRSASYELCGFIGIGWTFLFFACKVLTSEPSSLPSFCNFLASPCQTLGRWAQIIPSLDAKLVENKLRRESLSEFWSWIDFSDDPTLFSCLFCVLFYSKSYRQSPCYHSTLEEYKQAQELQWIPTSLSNDALKIQVIRTCRRNWNRHSMLKFLYFC